MKSKTSNVHEKNIKVAYIHDVDFPSAEANALDAVWTASALSRKVDTTFFMPRMKTSKSAFRQYYDIPASPLHLQSMYLDYLPDRFFIKNRNYYEQVLSFFLRYHPGWMGFQGHKILYIRHPKELLFWGLQREHQKWLQGWILCYESHDPLGLDLSKYHETNPFEIKNGKEGGYIQKVLRGAKNFDLIICNTQVLADDLESWSHNLIRPYFIPIASPLPRLSEPPRIRSFGGKIVLGYIGTIDQYRGVNILLEAMHYLPDNYTLRIVGKFRQENGVDPNWLSKCMEDPHISTRVEMKGPVPFHDIKKEIDQCDIVLQPASTDILDSRYATPQKSFDYMVRGKPIVAGDVPCHRELFQNGKTASLYHLDPQSLADCVVNLVKEPAMAEQIARGAWEQSATYNFTRRTDDILSLVDRCWKERCDPSRTSQ